MYVNIMMAILGCAVCMVLTPLIEKWKKGVAQWLFVVGIIFLLSLAPLITNWIVYGNELGFDIELPNIPTGSLDSWIGFYGSFFGAIIGGAITLLVLLLTIHVNRENTKKLIEAERENTIRLIEAERKNTNAIVKIYDNQLVSQYQPCYRYYVYNRHSTNNKGSINRRSNLSSRDGHLSISFDIENISNSIAHDSNIILKVSDGFQRIYLGNVKAGQELHIYTKNFVVPQEVGAKIEFEIVLLFNDIFSNCYKQKAQVIIECEGAIKRSYVECNYSIIYRILSMPIKLSCEAFNKEKEEYIENSRLVNE